MLEALKDLGIPPRNAALLVIAGGVLYFVLNYGYTWAGEEHEEIRQLQVSYELRGLRKERREITSEIRKVSGNPMISTETRHVILDDLQGELEEVQDEISALESR